MRDFRDLPRPPMTRRGLIMDDFKELMEYSSQQSVNSSEDYEVVQSSSFLERRRKSDSDLRANKCESSVTEYGFYHCYDQIIDFRTHRLNSITSSVSQDSGTYSENGENIPPPPLPSKIRLTPPPLPPRSRKIELGSLRDYEKSPPAKMSTPNPLHINLALPGLSVTAKKNLIHKYNHNNQFHDTNNANSNNSNNNNNSTSKKKPGFKFFTGIKGSEETSLKKTPKTPKTPKTHNSTRRRKLFRNSLLSSSIKRKSFKETGSTKYFTSNTISNDYKESIAEALEDGLPIIPFTARSYSSSASKTCCCACPNLHQSLEHLVNETEKEMKEEEQRLVSIMMKHADLLFTPHVLRQVLKKQSDLLREEETDKNEKGKTSNVESDESEYLDMKPLLFLS